MPKLQGGVNLKSRTLAPFYMPDDFNLFLWGDTQWGNVGIHESGIDQLFSMVESDYRGIPAKHNFAAHMGDHIEGIVIGDKRFAYDQLLPKKMFLGAMIDHAVEREMIIKHKTLFILKGNHEKVWDNTYGNVTKEIAKRLGVTYGGVSCVAHFRRKKNKSLICRGYHHHGAGRLNSNAKDYIQAEANRAAALKNRLKHMYDGACYQAMGHTHGLRIVPPDQSVKIITRRDGTIKQAYLMQDKGMIVDQAAEYIPPEFRWYLNTGSFLKGYTDDEQGTSYAEWGMMPPVELGFVVLAFRNARLEKAYKEVV